MRLSVNATRMELLRLRKRLLLARRGNKLLRDKQEELMRRFLGFIGELKTLRKELEEKLIRIFRLCIHIGMNLPGYKMKNIGLSQTEKPTIKKSENRIMNITAPRFEIENIPNPYVYSLIETPFEMDSFAQAMNEIMPRIVKLAQIESSLILLSEELEKTRRRVNALEYVLIPNITETIKYITMRLSELERSNLVRLMRVKELIESR
ncbi:MAG: V-type ATP synthase subunit D [Candidatus Omnitrophica bacterium]|nr:V-type ATP synthase subunit D [Candidatus Omnitrophota bacterium]